MGFRKGWQATATMALCGVLLVACGDDTSNADVVDAADGSDGAETSDPCEGLVTCDGVGTFCDFNTLITCEVDVKGCVVRVGDTDCASQRFGMCEGPDGAAECAVHHPCDTISTCTELGATCDGNQVLSCVEDDLGCYVERRNDCSDMGLTCSEDGTTARCGYDPCDDVDAPCFAPGRTCDSDVLTVCSRNVYGCLEQQTYDCAAAGSTCSGSGDLARCDVANACPTVSECAAEGAACDGSALEMCVKDAYGCRRAVTAQCAQTSVGAGFCLPTTDGVDACAITFNDQCEGVVTCSVAGKRCDGDEIVTCAPDAGACLVENRVNCADTGDICMDSETGPSCVDPCSLIDACPAELFCDGDRLVTCAIDASGCLGELSAVNCAATGKFCDGTGATPVCEVLPIITGSSSPNLAVPSESTVSDIIALSGNCTVGTIKVGINLSHSYIADLVITLKAPGGSPLARLHNGGGGGNDNIIGTYPDSLTPTDSLSAFSGANANGNWTLEITDTDYLDDGLLNSWDLTIECI